MLGLALGDALGAPYEGSLMERAAWKAIVAVSGEDLRWTDDTQMAMVLAESLLENAGLDADRLAASWAAAMEWSRGYGPGAAKMLKLIRGGADWRNANKNVFPDGSFGNGAAMRAAPLGLFYRRDAAALERAAAEAAAITHTHPLGVEGGVLIARATALALCEPFSARNFIAELLTRAGHEEYRRRLARAGELLDGAPEPAAVRGELGSSVRAHESAVTAVYAFCRHHDDFAAMMEFVISLGGDTDTIGAMAGGLWGARNGAGALPPRQLARLEAKDRLEQLGIRLGTMKK